MCTVFLDVRAIRGRHEGSLHAVLNREMALVQSKKTGNYLLVAGDDPVLAGKPMVSKVTDMVDIEVIAHTHPSTDFKLSDGDFNQLAKRGQNSTILIVSEKNVIEFRNIKHTANGYTYNEHTFLKLKSLE